MEKIFNPTMPLKNRETFPVTPLKSKRPVLGMTFLRLEEKYGLHDFFIQHKKNMGTRQIIKEFEDFRREIRTCKDITEFVRQYSSRHGQISKSKHINSEINRLKNKYNIEDFNEHIIHVHIKRGGKGQTVLWGFTYENNVFELLSIDPNHETID